MMAAVNNTNNSNSNIAGTNSKQKRKQSKKSIWKRILNNGKKGTISTSAASNTVKHETGKPSSGAKTGAAEAKVPSPKHKMRSSSPSPSVVAKPFFEAFEISEASPQQQQEPASPQAPSSGEGLPDESSSALEHQHPPGQTFALAGDPLNDTFSRSNSKQPSLKQVNSYSSRRTRSIKSHNSFKSKTSVSSSGMTRKNGNTQDNNLGSPTSVINFASSGGSNNDSSINLAMLNHSPQSARRTTSNMTKSNNNIDGGATISETVGETVGEKSYGNSTQYTNAATVMKEQMTLSTASMTATTAEGSSYGGGSNNPAILTSFANQCQRHNNNTSIKKDFGTRAQVAAIMAVAVASTPATEATTPTRQDNWAFEVDWDSQQPQPLAPVPQLDSSNTDDRGAASNVSSGKGMDSNPSRTLRAAVLPPVGEGCNDSNVSNHNVSQEANEDEGQENKETALLENSSGMRDEEEKETEEGVLLVKEVTRVVGGSSTALSASISSSSPAAAVMTTVPASAASTTTTSNTTPLTNAANAARSLRLKGSLKKSKNRVSGGVGQQQPESNKEGYKKSNRNTKKNKRSPLSNKKSPSFQSQGLPVGGLGEGAAATRGFAPPAPTASGIDSNYENNAEGNSNNKKKKKGVGEYSSPRMVSNERYLRKVNSKNSSSKDAAESAVSTPAAPVNNKNVTAGEADKGNKKKSIDNNKQNKSTSEAPHLYAEIIIPYKTKKQPQSIDVARQSSSRSNGTEGGDISLAMTSISSLTGRESLFGLPHSSVSGMTGAMGGFVSAYSQQGIVGIWCADDAAAASGGDVKTVPNNVNLNAAEEENYFDYSDHKEDANPNGVYVATTTGAGEKHPGDLNSDDNIIDKVIGALYEVVKSTCRCFDLGLGISDAGEGVGGASKSVGGGAATAASVVGMGAATIMETVNDTTATIANMSRSNCNASNVTMTDAAAANSAGENVKTPTFSEPMPES